MRRGIELVVQKIGLLAVAAATVCFDNRAIAAVTPTTDRLPLSQSKQIFNRVSCKRSRPCAALLSITSILLLFSASPGSTTLIGDFVSASIQPLQTSAAVITQFVSPKIVVDPGVEFSAGSFTPNAGGQPLPIQLINSFGIELDVFASEFEIKILQVPGSNTGFTSFTGPVVRVNLSDLNPSGGGFISGITQTAGPTSPITSLFVSSPSSVGVDFVAFGVPVAGSLPNIYRFQLQTTIPEPATFSLVAIGLVGIITVRRKRVAV